LRNPLIRALFFGAAILVSWTCYALDLQTIEGVELVSTHWADGDSFRVRFPDGTEHTVRLYGADCLEWHVTDGTDARRLRDQRWYFGITGYGGTPAASITLAKSLGEAAALEVRTRLAKPFTVHTTFADARGDAKYRRIYAFVTTADNEDLATVLVTKGLARAHGVYRGTPRGLSKAQYQDQLRDAELLAAHGGQGIWAYTDWSALPVERSALSAEREAGRLETGKALPTTPLDINTASRDELMSLPGIGEVTANAIIEKRPYRRVDDLLRVRGIGPKLLDMLRPGVAVGH